MNSWRSLSVVVFIMAGLVGVITEASAYMYSEAGATTVPAWYKNGGGGILTMLSMSDFGLAVGDDINALSLGDDPPPNPTWIGSQKRVDVFSVTPDWSTPTGRGGMFATRVNNGDPVERDVYREDHYNLNVLYHAGLVPDGAVDAYEDGDFNPLSDPDNTPWIYFSLTSSSPTLTTYGWSAGDVLMAQYQNPGTLARFAEASEIGGPVDIDALSMNVAVKDGSPYDYVNDLIIYSLNPDDGHVHQVGLGTSSSSTPHDYVTEFGLAATDDIVALEHVFAYGQGNIVTGIGDFNGDGTSDISIYRPDNGLWAVRLMTRFYFGGGNDIPASGDYNGDGTTEGAIFRPEEGLWAVRGFSRFSIGEEDDLSVPADYNGDGSTDVAVFRQSKGLWVIDGQSNFYFGQDRDIPIPGDYDGDGTDEAGIFRSNRALWALRGVTREYFGAAGDIPVGAQVGEIAVYRPLSGLWAVRGGDRRYFGGGTDLPIIGNFFGDGIFLPDDIAIFRQSTGLWAISGLSRVYFGGVEDIPLSR